MREAWILPQHAPVLLKVVCMLLPVVDQNRSDRLTCEPWTASWHPALQHVPRWTKAE